MSKEQHHADDGDLNEKLGRIADELGSLRKEVAIIRKNTEASQTEKKTPEGSIERAVAEYRQLPENQENGFRWGFIGAWGKSGHKGTAHAAYSINTTTVDGFLDTTDNEEVTAFVEVFTNPNTVAVCKYIFRHSENTMAEDIQKGCRLTAKEVTDALAPLLEWHFIEQKDQQFKANGQGIIFCLTLISMTKEAIKHKTNKWD